MIDTIKNKHSNRHTMLCVLCAYKDITILKSIELLL